MKKKDKINIYEYTDYRLFLKDSYGFMKEQTPYFSYRYFAKVAGFTSPNYLKLVIDGVRNLSTDAIQKFAKAFKLNAKETHYFRLLILMNQAGTDEERDFYLRQIFKNKVYKNLKPLNQAQYEYYSNWYYIPLRELVGRSDFKNDPKWIARQFIPNLKEVQVKEGLELLQKLGFICETPNGSYVQAEQSVTTGDEVTSLAVMNYHRTMIGLGLGALDRFDEKQRDVSSLTMGVSKKSLKKIKSMIQDFRKELITLSHEDANQFEDVVQINFQMFPLVCKNQDEDTDGIEGAGDE